MNALRWEETLTDRSRPAYKLTALFRLHNIFLTLISGLLLALMVEEM